jgi:isoamylase
VSRMIRFRQSHPVLRAGSFYQHRDYAGSGKPDISFHGTQLGQPDWSPGSRVLAFLLCGKHAEGPQRDIYVAMNTYWGALPFRLPATNEGNLWRAVVNTSMPAPNDIFEVAEAPRLDKQDEVIVGGRSIMVLVEDGDVTKRRE